MKSSGRARRIAPVYYNEWDAYPAEWLRRLMAAGLIPEGDVDERSIKEVQQEDLKGYRQCHFFAGIAGWSLALQYAGWDEAEQVWTGSCPCQPFSIAGKRKGVEDERHLWPEFHRLIRACQPTHVFGEQVASKDGRGWLAGVQTDLEGDGYATGSADMGAASVRAPHARQRLWWVAYTYKSRLERVHSTRRKINLQSTFETVRGFGEAKDRVLQRLNGISNRLDGPRTYRSQIKALGNSIVPAVAAEFIKAYMEVIGLG